jgi:Domain of unknown function (DUF5615)
VVAIAEISKGIPDERVIERAFDEGRVTEDADFGDMVDARRLSAGVILVKFDHRARRAKAAAVVEAVAKLGARLRDGFVVIAPGRVRVARRPHD